MGKRPGVSHRRNAVKAWVIGCLVVCCSVGVLAEATQASRPSTPLDSTSR